MVHTTFSAAGLGKAAFSSVPGATEDGVEMATNGNGPTPPDDRREDFKTRLAKARQAGKPEQRPLLNETTAFGIAFRLVAELVSGLVIGAGIGWLLDRWLGTSPWLLVVFFVFGVAAGISNVFRAARQMNARTATPDKVDADGSGQKEGKPDDGGPEH